MKKSKQKNIISINKEEFEDYDFLTVYVKSNAVNKIISYYKLFRWELKNQERNKKFKNVENLTFFRPHKIENKDELQILQVDMEFEISKIERNDKYKYSKSTCVGLSIGFAGLLLFIIGLSLIISENSSVGIIILGAIIGIVGVVLFALASYTATKMQRKERIKFIRGKRESRNNILHICEEAYKLMENLNGKSKNIS